MEYKEHPGRVLRHWLSGPFIWMMLIPITILDVFLEVYHHVAFPLYGLTLRKRSEYIIFDRAKLSYLPWYDKLFCTYCAYANGIFLYAAAIAADTEKYWCGIKHQRARIKALRDEERTYLAYGDKKGFEDLSKINKDE